MLKQLFLPFFSYKYLLFQLTQREIKARYKQSIIGYAWVVLNPLAQLAVYTFVFSVVFAFPTNNIPYVIFLYAGLLPWTFFQSSISSSTQSLVDNSALLRKVAFPREVIPYSVILSKIVDLFISAIIFMIFIAAYRIPLSPTIFFVIPIFFIELFLVLGLSLMLCTMNLFYRDIQYLANLILMLWMYMSPVVYALSLVPLRFVKLYKLNPLVGIMEGYRSAIFHYPFEWSIILWAAGISLITFIAGYIFFKRSERVFSDIA